MQFATWDLATDPNLPPKYITAFKNIVWFTGNSYPGPITPYEASLAAYLDGGGHLFLSGQDLLDQGAGTTDFVHNYLHVTAARPRMTRRPLTSVAWQGTR